MFQFIDLAWVAAFAVLLWAVSRAVAFGWFDWVKIPFSRNGVKKVITTDKAAWATYSRGASIAAVILYAVYRVFYQ